MKIAITGKGGVGKTFIAGTLATAYARAGRPVIAIDADPSPNLGLMLGLSLHESECIRPLAENEELVRRKTGTDYIGVFRLTFSVDDIINKYAVPTPSGVNLIVMGVIRSMGSGCICPANSFVRALLRNLIVERQDVVILDMEAGTEHLGRGTAEHVDIMLVVSDANIRSLETARTICRIAAGARIRKIGLIGNKITGIAVESAFRSYAQAHGLDIITMIPFDAEVAGAGISGKPINEVLSPAVSVLKGLAQKLTDSGT